MLLIIFGQLPNTIIKNFKKYILLQKFKDETKESFCDFLYQLHSVFSKKK